MPSSNISTLDWTIGMVNYSSSVYINWQLKILYEANDPSSFNLIIVDNSNPHQKEELDRLIEPYYKKYKNIEIIYHNPSETTASGQHGEGLSLVLKKCNTKYLLVQDPDFFWVKKDYLNIFKNYLEQNEDNVAIGAPYPNKVGIGDPWFPSAYGCAYKKSALGEADFYANVSEEKRIESFTKYPISEGFEFSYDVGWKIREKLSDKNFFSFSQRSAYELMYLIGVHSFEVISKEYFHNKKTIGFHLFRGTFTGHVTEDHKDPKSEIDSLWLKTRDDYGSYFYKYMTNNLSSKLYRKQQVFLFIARMKNYLHLLAYQLVLPNLRKFYLGRKVIYIIKKTLLMLKIIKR